MSTAAELLVKLIPVLIIIEYIGDFIIFDKYGHNMREPGIDIDHLTSLVVALLFFFAFGNFSKRLKSVEFKEN